MGIDLQTGEARYTFGVSQLLDGIDVVVVVLGLFAVGETLYVASTRHEDTAIAKVTGWTWMTGSDWKRSWKPWLRGTFLGFPIGALPVGGAEIPTFLSYWLEKRLSRHPEEFGHGAIEGVAGPEAANNAAATGVLVPLLTFGLPTSATAAIMLAAFQQYSLQPGPLLFESNPELVWGLIASLYIGNVMLLILNLPMAPLWARLLEIPQPLLYASIVLFATVGSYSLNNSVFDVGLVYLIGFAGFLMRRLDIPIAPAILGLILGPIAEQQFRRALAISQGDGSVFFTRPLSAALLAIALAILLLPVVLKPRRQASIIRAGMMTRNGSFFMPGPKLRTRSTKLCVTSQPRATSSMCPILKSSARTIPARSSLNGSSRTSSAGPLGPRSSLNASSSSGS